MELYTELQYIDERGRIERLDYTTKTPKGEEMGKYANVYLPFGYDGSEKRYDVLYLMHGGCGSPDTWLDFSSVKNMLDYMFLKGKAEPFIVVFPQMYYPSASYMRTHAEKEDWEVWCPKGFQPELRNVLIPLIDRTYRTAAGAGSTPGEASKHRAFGGFSLGAACTWSALVHNPDLIGTFIPLSGGCWEYGFGGGGEELAENTALFMKAMDDAGIGKDGIRIFTGTGTEDLAKDGIIVQVENMKKYPEYFEFSEDPAEGNLHMTILEGGKHDYSEVLHHLYSALPYLFG